MANSLNINLKGKYVMLKGHYKDEVFKCEGGFGESPDTIGSAVFVKSLKDGREFRISGYDIRRLAKDHEIILGSI